MCYIQTKRGITGNSDTTNTNSPWGTMPWPCPRRSVVKSQVKCHSQGGQNKRPLEGRVKAPTMTKGESWYGGTSGVRLGAPSPWNIRLSPAVLPGWDSPSVRTTGFDIEIES